MRGAQATGLPLPTSVAGHAEIAGLGKRQKWCSSGEIWMLQRREKLWKSCSILLPASKTTDLEVALDVDFDVST